MATTSRNSYVKETYDQSQAGTPTSATNPINQGDIVVWDQTLNGGLGGIRVPAAQSDMAKYVGVAAQQTPVASLGDSLLSLEIWKSCIVKMKTTPGDVYLHFSPVYWNETLDVQTIVLSSASNARTVPVGWILLDSRLVMAGIYSLTGATGVDAQVWLNPKWPAAILV